MSNSDRAFNQVKAILNKLDRSIDQAREKRLGGPIGAESPRPEPPAAAINAPAATINGPAIGGPSVTPVAPARLQAKRLSPSRDGRGDASSWRFDRA